MQTPRELPAAYCWYGHPDLTGLGVCSADSNGCAAGGTLSEAIVQGFCELVERDSVALWWYHRSRMPGVDLASFADPWTAACVDHHATALGRELWALDLTADLGVPTFAAVSRRLGAGPEDVLVGFGAHLDARVALTRALTEVNQFLPAVAGPDLRRNRYGVDDPDTARWFGTVRVADQPWLAPDPTRPPRTAGGPPGADHRRRRGRRAALRTPGGAGRPGGDRPRPVPSGRRPGGREGRRAGPAALLAPARSRPAVGRAGPSRPEPAGRRRDVGQSAERLLLVGRRRMTSVVDPVGGRPS